PLAHAAWRQLNRLVFVYVARWSYYIRQWLRLGSYRGGWGLLRDTRLRLIRWNIENVQFIDVPEVVLDGLVLSFLVFVLTHTNVVASVTDAAFLIDLELQES